MGSETQIIGHQFTISRFKNRIKDRIFSGWHPSNTLHKLQTNARNNARNTNPFFDDRRRMMGGGGGGGEWAWGKGKCVGVSISSLGNWFPRTAGHGVFED